MTPDKAMSYAREDIAELRRAPTHSDCKVLHISAIGYFRGLHSCGVISAAQQKILMTEADAELAGWCMPTEPHVQQAK